MMHLTIFLGAVKLQSIPDADNPHYSAASRQCWKNFHWNWSTWMKLGSWMADLERVTC